MRGPEQLSLDARLAAAPAHPGPAAPRPPRERAPRPTIETSRNRLLVTGAVFAVLFLTLVGRLVQVTLIERGEPALVRASGQQVLAEGRADVVDRNGVLLATNLATASLYANPKRVLDRDEAARKLSRLLPELSYASVLAKLKSGRSFVWIKRNLTPRQHYAVNRLGLPGLAFQNEWRRVYPQGRLAAHALGFTGIDNRGLAGVEQYFDDRLTDPRAARHGALELALDLRIQHVVREELARAVADHRTVGAGGVVLDARSGEVLALVSLPDFEPNRIASSAAEARFNRVTLGVYELGSVFKTFTVAMALEGGRVALSDGYDVANPIRVAKFVIRDLHAKKRWLTLPEIFVYSSNIGAAKVALEVGAVGQKNFLESLGLLRRADIELPEVGLPLYPTRWRDINTMTIGFGHGIAVSPLQLASGVAAVVNGGVLVPATLLKRHNGEEVTARRVMSRRTSAVMRRLMRLVVEHGTGKRASAQGYLVGGKTGTAEKAGRGGYRKEALISSFVGVFPMTAPRYVVFIMLDEPKGTKATHGFAGGGWTAAPVVSRVVSRVAPILGVEPVDETGPEIRRAMGLGDEAGAAKLASF